MNDASEEEFREDYLVDEITDDTFYSITKMIELEEE
jgi:hypothetical protein